MKKIKLHWQILIALILSIVYGILFPTDYSIREKSYKSFIRNGTDKAVVDNLRNLEGRVYNTQQEFVEACKSEIGEEQFNKNRHVILKASYKNDAVIAVSWMGDIFLRALKMLIIPLILSSLISGITNIGSGANLGRLGLKTFGYYVMTSLFAILTGLFLVNVIMPGVGADHVEQCLQCHLRGHDEDHPVCDPLHPAGHFWNCGQDRGRPG